MATKVVTDAMKVRIEQLYKEGYSFQEIALTVKIPRCQVVYHLTRMGYEQERVSKCYKCIYGSYRAECNYYLITHNRRNSKADECDKYQEGERISLGTDLFANSINGSKVKRDLMYTNEIINDL